MPQEPKEVTKELTVQEFGLFTNKERLIQFEQNNRMRIISAPLSIYEKFILKYREVVGEDLPYAKAVNQPAPKSQRVNPKDNAYGVVFKTETKEVAVRRRVDGELKTIIETQEVTTGVIADDGYWEVQFQPKASPIDPDSVTLSLNGKCLHIQRDAPVILPGPFLEVADHGTYPVYIQLPNQPRKVTGHRMHFPYIVLRRCNRSEYEQLLADGNKITADARKKEEAA